MALPAILAGAGLGALNVVGELSKHPIGAWLLLITALALDAGVGAFIPFLSQGLSGSLFSYLLGLLGFHITIYAWHLLILFAFYPVIMFAINSSVN